MACPAPTRPILLEHVVGVALWAVCFSRVDTCYPESSANVLRHRDHFKMLRVHTTRHPTQMVNGHSFGNVADESFVNPAMGIPVGTLLPVARREFAAVPDPVVGLKVHDVSGSSGLLQIEHP